MTNFIKGLFGWNPVTGKYSTTETLSIILIGLVVVVTAYEMITGNLFQHYTDLLAYGVGGATGNKVAKGIATTVQSFRKEGEENNE